MSELSSVSFSVVPDFSAIPRGLDDIESKAEDTASKVKSSFSDAFSSVDTSGLKGGLEGVQGATEGVSGAAKEAHDSFSLLDAITLAGAIAAVELVVSGIGDMIDKVKEAVTAFGDLEEASTRAAFHTSSATVANSAQSYQAASKAVQEQAKQLGVQYGMDPAQITQLIGTIATYGGSTASSALTPYFQLARTTGTSIGDLAGALPGTMKAFNLTDTQKTAEVMADVWQKYSLSPTDLGRSGTMLMQSPSLVQGLGGFSGSMATLGDLAQRNITPTMAATSLVGISTTLEGLGKDIKEQQVKGGPKGQMETVYSGAAMSIVAAGGPGLLEEMMNKSVSLDQKLVDLKQHGVDFTDLFKGRQGMVAGAIAQDIGAITSFTGVLNNSTDNLKTMDAAAMDDLNPHLEEMDTAVNNVSTSLGDLFKGSAIGASDWIKGIAESISGFIDTINRESGGDIFKAISLSFDHLKSKFAEGLTVGGILVGLGLVKAGFETILPIVAQVGAAIVKTIAGDAVAAFGTLSKTIAAFVAPLAGIVAGAALVATGLAAIGYSLDPGKFTTFNKVATDALNGIATTAKLVISDISSGNWGKAADDLKTAFFNAKDYIMTIDWKSLGQDIVTMIGDGAKAIVGAAIDIGTWIHDQLTGWIGGGGPHKLGEDIATTIGDAVNSFFSSKWDVWDDGIVPAFKTISSWLDVGWKIASGIGQGIVDKLKPAVAPAINGLIDDLQALANGVIATMQYSINSIIDGINGIGTGLQQIVNSAGNFLGGGGSENQSSNNLVVSGSTYNQMLQSGALKRNNETGAYQYNGQNVEVQSFGYSGVSAQGWDENTNQFLDDNGNPITYPNEGTGKTVSQLPNVIKDVNTLAGKASSGISSIPSSMSNWQAPTIGHITLDPVDLSNLKIGADEIKTSGDEDKQSSDQNKKTSDKEASTVVDLMKVGTDIKIGGTALGQNVAAINTASSQLVHANSISTSAMVTGAQVSSRFLTDSGNAVSIALTSSGKEVAVIGKVAAQQWDTTVKQGGATWLSDSRNAAMAHANIITNSAADWQKAANAQDDAWMNTGKSANANMLTATQQSSNIWNTGVSNSVNLLSAWTIQLPQFLGGGTISNQRVGGSSSGGAGVQASGNININGSNHEFADVSCDGSINMLNPLIYTSPSGNVSYYNPNTYQSNGPQTGGYSASSGGSFTSSGTVLGSSGGYSTSVRTSGGVYTGNGGAAFMAGFDEGGISTGPMIAGVSLNSKPEIHLTQDNVREFLGQSNATQIVQLVCDSRVLAEVVLNSGMNNMRYNKGAKRR